MMCKFKCNKFKGDSLICIDFNAVCNDYMSFNYSYIILESLKSRIDELEKKEKHQKGLSINDLEKLTKLEWEKDDIIDQLEMHGVHIE